MERKRENKKKVKNNGAEKKNDTSSYIHNFLTN